MIEQSNFDTGIDFEERLRYECDKKISEINRQCIALGQPPFPPRHPDFIVALERSDPAFINSILGKSKFVTCVRQNKYDIFFKYALSGKEKESLNDLNEIAKSFNINFANSRAYSPSAIVYCTEVTLDGKNLYFHLVHYGKWQAPTNTKKELQPHTNFDNSAEAKIKLLHDYDKNEIVSVSLKETPHFLICGESGSGKTFFSIFLTASICKSLGSKGNNIKLFIFDFKGDEALKQFRNHKRYYFYKECQNGLEELYDLFSKRLSGEIPDDSTIVIYFDELASYINSFSKRADKEAQQKIIAEILMMGRSKSFHLITSTQRPDSSLFQLGSRINYSFKYLMGSSCKNSDSQKMMFDTTDVEFKACKQGSGFVSINGDTPRLASVPIIDNHKAVYKALDTALSN